MSELKTILSAAAAISLTSVAAAQADDGFTMSQGEYETSAHYHEFFFDFDHPSDVTCPYLDPRWRHLFQSDWVPEMAFQPDPDRLSGMILRVPLPEPELADEPGTVILTHVGYHDADWNLAYSVFYQQIRIEHVNAACHSIDDSQSRIQLRIMIIGTHSSGAEAASEYVESGQLEADMRRYRDGIIAAIAD